MVSGSHWGVEERFQLNKPGKAMSIFPNSILCCSKILSHQLFLYIWAHLNLAMSSLSAGLLHEVTQFQE